MLKNPTTPADSIECVSCGKSIQLQLNLEKIESRKDRI
jgi:hypothetical protein